MKSAGFHVKSKDPLARNCNPMFKIIILKTRKVNGGKVEITDLGHFSNGY